MLDVPRPIVNGGGRSALLSTFVALTVLSACGSPTAGDASTSAAPKPSASVAAPVIVQADYCKRVCERATQCGNESALAMKNLEPEAKGAVERSGPETTRVCVESCSGETATQVRLQLADRCNQEKECAGFAKCLNELAGELKK
jgi:hypothetical protein